VESDPIALRGGPNTYAYVRNDPLNLTDGGGLQTMSAAAGAREEAEEGCPTQPRRPLLVR